MVVDFSPNSRRIWIAGVRLTAEGVDAGLLARLRRHDHRDVRLLSRIFHLQYSELLRGTTFLLSLLPLPLTVS